MPSSSSSPASFISAGWGNLAYKLLSFTDSAFFFMNHAGSASGLSVCKTTNQEKFDLTQAGKFPSITRGKCWSRGERHKAGDSRRGMGGQGRGPSLGSLRLQGGWETRQAPAASVSGVGAASYPGLSWSTPSSSWAPLGPASHLGRSHPSHSLALRPSPHGAPPGAPGRPRPFTPPSLHLPSAVPAASTSSLRFQNLTHGHAHGWVSWTLGGTAGSLLGGRHSLEAVTSFSMFSVPSSPPQADCSTEARPGPYRAPSKWPPCRGRHLALAPAPGTQLLLKESLRAKSPGTLHGHWYWGSARGPAPGLKLVGAEEPRGVRRN